MENNKAKLSIGNEAWDFDILQGHDRPRRHRHQQALRKDRALHLRSGLHLHRRLRLLDHLHRRRRGHPPLSRLSDRRARRKHAPSSKPPTCFSMASLPNVGAGGGFQIPHHAPHDGARADGALLPGFSARRASDGGHVRRGRRDVGLLSRLRPTSMIPTSAWSRRSA